MDNITVRAGDSDLELFKGLDGVAGAGTKSRTIGLFSFQPETPYQGDAPDLNRDQPWHSHVEKCRSMSMFVDLNKKTTEADGRGPDMLRSTSPDWFRAEPENGPWTTKTTKADKS